jgi:hypothetical protein
MFKEFRQQYPQGSLVTEFVRVDREKYIVRALIQIDGITILTSLAAANSVEEAEDKARDRVLTLFDLAASPAEAKTTMVSSTNSINKNNNNPIVPKIESLPVTPPKIEEAENTIDSSPIINSPNIATQTKSNGKQIDLFDAPPKVTSETMPKARFAPELETAAKETKTKANKTDMTTLEPEASDSTDPMELIAKTEIELERLGWTKEQGRDFLLQHYGKRSRHFLNERELQDFLNHLRNID